MADSQNKLVLFEEGYFFRTSKNVTSQPDIAITELVANAWDAGSMNVKIEIPIECGEPISIIDDGTGMTDLEFRTRWMTLNYDRQKRQGKYVEFPTEQKTNKRVAYGRNGVGRHAMLCFSSSYTVETWKDGVYNKYYIDLNCGNTPFEIVDHISSDMDGHGTKISAFVERNLPKVNEMLDVISARFLYDPNFRVSINGKGIELSDHKGLFEHKKIQIEGIAMEVIVIDSTKGAKKTQQHGIAFWISGRLVGQPTWSSHNTFFLDGRSKIAKRYTIVVKADGLIDEVLPDWTGFIDTPKIKQIFRELRKHINGILRTVMIEQIKETQLSVIEESRDEIEKLDLLGQRKLSHFIEEITTDNPTISFDYLKSSVDAVINMEKASKGEQLLIQLSKMAPDEIDKLADMLENWNINDILAVLQEIDRRIIVIEAIEKLQNEKTTDELHTLHPLVLESRWLFGAEFDSPMFTTNVSLSTVVKNLFKTIEMDAIYLADPRKRPDIVVLNDFTLKAVCTNKSDIEALDILKPDQILIIELKRGGFEITSNEVYQTERYVRNIKNSGVLHKQATIKAFVVGANIGDVDTSRTTDSGTIQVVTYGHLIETASRKLFDLRSTLREHYDSMGKQSIVEKALKTPNQIKI